MTLAVDADSFLRRLPLAMDTRQRIRLEAILYSADGVAEAWGRLCAIADHPDTLINGRGAEALGAAWAIVDHLDALRQLVASLLKGHSLAASNEWNELTKTVRSLRNDFRHLNEKADNLSRRKGAMMPLFGGLSYLRVRTEDIVSEDPLRVRSCQLVTLISGTRGEITAPAINPIGRKLRRPVSNLELSAFDTTILMDEAVESTLAIANRLGHAAEAAFFKAAASAVLPAEIELKDVLAGGPGGALVTADFDFNGAEVDVWPSI